jgi:tetratricopeptide (TPR) repeat protein
MPKANAAAVRALSLDDTAAEAHASLGFIKLHHDWDWPGAEKEIQRAIELNPNYANGHHWYSHYWITMGQVQESLTESERALTLDPLDPTITGHMPWHYYYAHQYDRAIQQCRKTLEIDPNLYWEHLEGGRSYEQKAMFEEALADLRKATIISPDNTWGIAAMGHAYASAGQRAQAQKVLDRLKELAKQRFVAPSDIAMIYAGLGEKDQALAWLDRAYQERSWYMVLLNVDPRLDKLRSDARFQDLVLSRRSAAVR